MGRKICVPLPFTVFLALKKVGVRQYEDSDSKPGVGVRTQAQLPAIGHRRQLQLYGGPGACPTGNFWFQRRLGVSSSDI